MVPEPGRWAWRGRDTTELTCHLEIQSIGPDGWLQVEDCVTNYSKLSRREQLRFIISWVLWVRNLGVAWLGDSGSGSLMRLLSRCWLEPPSSEGPMGWRIHFQAGSLAWLASQCQLLAGGLSSSPVASPQGCSRVLTAWQPGSFRANDPRGSRAEGTMTAMP